MAIVIPLQGEGDEFPNIDVGDLIIDIIIDKYNYFIRKGPDLLYKCEIFIRSTSWY